MRLQLDSLIPKTADHSRTEAAESHRSEQSPAVGSLSTDTSQVSGTSSLLGRLDSERTLRIQALTSQVQGGTYQPGVAAIAKSIIEQSLA